MLKFLMHYVLIESDSNPFTFEFVPSTTRMTILNIPNHDYYMKLPEENAFRYVRGYLIRKCTEMHTCKTCKDFINEANTVIDNTALYCSFELIIIQRKILLEIYI